MYSLQADIFIGDIFIAQRVIYVYIYIYIGDIFIAQRMTCLGKLKEPSFSDHILLGVQCRGSKGQ